MSDKGNHLQFLGVFLMGVFLGGFSVLTHNTNTNNTSESSASPLSLRHGDEDAEAGGAPSKHRRGLLALSEFVDPKSVSVKQTDTSAYDSDDRDVHVGPMPLQERPAAETRTVHVGSMCRCKSGLLPKPGPVMAGTGRDTRIVQPPSLATGAHGKHFVLHASEGGCSCIKNARRTPAETTKDMFLKKMTPKCKNPHPAAGYDWRTMPDLGVEETLPVFVGVLSYESPLSLNGTLHNWLEEDLFRRVRAQEVFVQLNHRSSADDDVLRAFRVALRRRERPTPVTALGAPAENRHPGLAIADFCRRAEAHPAGHPNGENLLMFLEKDWRFLPHTELERLMHGVNALVQRGVPYVRLKQRSPEVPEDRTWPCPAQGFPFECTRAHQHRWSNQPMVLSCKWFLRYLEPFALFEDPIMYGCRSSFQEHGYCDWEEALQDGRIAWTNSQWVVGNMVKPNRLFYHEEVDQ